MSKPLALLFSLASMSLLAMESVAQTPAAGDAADYFNQNVADSNPLRNEQVRELDAYIITMAANSSRFEQLFKPDYS